jgi:riboflavin synthase
MFTGIVTDIGEIIGVESSADAPGLKRFRIACAYGSETIALGASIAHAGICLSVVATGKTGAQDWFEVEAAAETLRVTLADFWKMGTKLNLERALKIGDELGGHLVTGHVDGLASIVAREEVTPEAKNWGATARFLLEAPKPLHRFIAPKGSVVLDGVSLTVNGVEETRFDVLLIPHTLKMTTFEQKKAGDTVHLEVDLMARYAARLAETA